jgi:hypothetical protein
MKAAALGILLILISQQPATTNASIFGRVLPEYTGLTVSLLRYSYDDDGGIKLQTFKTARTSNEIGKFGEYRFDDVEAGEYYLSASAFGLAAPKGQVMPTTYYPGTSDLSKASIVVIQQGQDLRLSDLNFFPVPAPAVQVRLVDATGDAAINKTCVTLSLKERGSNFHFGLTNCKPTDVFRLPLLEPATYDIFAGWSASPPNSQITGAGETFEIRNLDLEVEVVVSLARAMGRITIEEPDGTVKPAAGLQLSLQPKQIGPGAWAKTAADGSFQFDRIGRNHYTVELTGLPPNAYIARLIDDNIDVLKDGLEVRSTDVHLDGLISLAGGTLEGTIAGAHGAIVALVPDLPERQHYLYRTAKTDDNGWFTITPIAPGSYRLYAWSRLNGAAFKNADFMKAFENRGTPVVIEKNGRTTIEAKVLDNLP